MSPEELFFKLNRLHRFLIVAALCILLLVGFYFLVVADQLVVINGLENQIATIEKEILNEERKLAEGPKLEAKIKGLRSELQAMVSSLPEKQDIEELLQKITELLSENHLSASRFAPGREVVNEELYYARIPIALNVTGDYRKQGMFLASLNSLPRVVNVPSITLRAGGMTEIAKKLDVVPLEAKIDGETFRRLSQEEIAAISAKKQAATKPGPAAGARPAPPPPPAKSGGSGPPRSAP
ncbi:MAG: type 4a pilus biogenesis protein PilO [Desulfomonile tiedjei]|nr:type 4a pilus biogenesis protein PilO [Desulfomonile tiedjei]